VGSEEKEVSPECCRRSFAASLKDTAERLLKDPSVAPRAVHHERMKICQQCDRYRELTQTCEICGCFMPLKTTMSNMKCPLDKWFEHGN
jgi:hypothetical protein